jgi:hypothetical protein
MNLYNMSRTYIPMIMDTYSTLDIRCSGLALSTTNMRIGTNESAPSSFRRCRIKPIRHEQQHCDRVVDEEALWINRESEDG